MFHHVVATKQVHSTLPDEKNKYKYVFFRGAVKGSCGAQQQDATDLLTERRIAFPAILLLKLSVILLTQFHM